MCGAEENRLSVRRTVEEAAKGVFGECGASSLCVDVLRVSGGRAVLRVPASQLRKAHAAVLLHGGDLRVRRHSPALQSLL